MFDVMQKNPRRAAIVLGTVAALAIIYLFLVARYTWNYNDGHSGAMLDDTWIHVRFAEHISQGEGLAYNEGVLTAGATSPLWVLLLAIPFKIFDPAIMQQVDIAIAMSAIGHVLSVLAITGFGWWATRHAWIGFAGGVLTVLTGRYIWMGLAGMEITTFTALCIMSIWSHMHDIRTGRALGWQTGIWLALAVLGRPEAGLLAALIGLDALIIVPLRDCATREEIFKRWRASWRGILAVILLGGTLPLVNLAISGYPVPNTFRAKSMLGHEMPDLPRALLWMSNVDHGALFIFFATVGTAFLLWQARKQHGISIVWGLWPVLFILGVLFLGKERFVVNHSRYVAPAIPFIALAAVIGVQNIVLTLHRLAVETPYIVSIPIPFTLGRWLKKFMFPVGLIAILAITTFDKGIINGWRVANDVRQLRKMHVAAGYWFLDVTDPGDSIALNDVGAIVHISNLRVIDLEGLVTPEVIDATQNTADYTCAHDLQLARLMLKDPPKFIGIFPWFYPCLRDWPGALQAFNIFTITGPTVLAGGELVIYWPLWENWPMLAAIPENIIPINAPFEHGIELAGYQTRLVESGLELTLYWQAHAQPSEDYHVFVHLVDESGNLVSQPDSQGNPVNLQHDSEPQQIGVNHFSTSLWRAGDIIKDVHVIEWPDVSVFRQPGLSLNVGMYRFPGGQRLEIVRDGSGAGDQISLALRLLPRLIG